MEFLELKFNWNKKFTKRDQENFSRQKKKKISKLEDRSVESIHFMGREERIEEMNRASDSWYTNIYSKYKDHNGGGRLKK